MMYHVTEAESCRRWKLEIGSFVASRKDCDLDAKGKLIYLDGSPVIPPHVGVECRGCLRDEN